jgi:hypothetical protein
MPYYAGATSRKAHEATEDGCPQSTHSTEPSRRRWNVSPPHRHIQASDGFGNFRRFGADIPDLDRLSMEVIVMAKEKPLNLVRVEVHGNLPGKPFSSRTVHQDPDQERPYPDRMFLDLRVGITFRVSPAEVRRAIPGVSPVE